MAFGNCKVAGAVSESTTRQLLWWNCGGISSRPYRPFVRFSPGSCVRSHGLDTFPPHSPIAHLRFLQYAWPQTRAPTVLPAAVESVFGDIMDNTIQKSCWGVTARAVAGFAGVLVLAYLFGGLWYL